ncbi:acetolactate synthase large subunit [Desulforhopalus singaporensis]|uniref:Acetolactate synthase n=1 Tax=Desulforhopalus singaporensis TaxID=91360 RepID=A0A1H0TRU4_9BACT|nr:acetolactate synthase large subunit [Desulforhopalus singaporensis]SDP56689.1 acetolactate synthase, large subunit [Desulforhopalus singaporensis]
MQTMNGAQLIIKLLERQSIDKIAGIPGGANLPLYDALCESQTIRHILCRHEQGAGFLAQGIARATGGAGVCFATSGPGATNILTAIADAYLDSIPVVCITGQVPASLIGTDAFQEVDTYGMTIPITKHNYLVRKAEDLLHIIPRAFELALSGRPGPVLIDVPKDVQVAEVSFEKWPTPGSRQEQPPADMERLRAAADMINRAKRPVLCLGGGIIHAGASEEAKGLIERGSIPATMTLMGLGSLPADHYLSMGMLGMHAARSTNIALQDCDLFIAAGARFDDRATGKIVEFCPEANVIHMDIDPAEVSKLKAAHIGLVGDVKQTLGKLIPLITPNEREIWRNQIEVLQETYPMTSPEATVPDKPYGLILKVAELLDEDGFVATDVGKHQMWTAQVFPFNRPRQLLTSGGLGTMGFGLPAAIGASLAYPDKTVVLFTGDGSLQMNIQELATAVEQDLNVKIIVMNNNSLGLVRQQQNLFYQKQIFASDFQIDIDFAAIAKGFGMKAYNAEPGCDLDQLFEKVLGQPGPCLINIPIAKEEEVYPMVPPGASNSEMLGGCNAEQCK